MEKDIAKLLEEMEHRLSTQIAESEERTKREIMVLIENDVVHDIKAVAEGVMTLVNREPTPDKVTAHIEDMNIRVPALEQASKAQRADIDKIKEELQKAQ